MKLPLSILTLAYCLTSPLLAQDKAPAVFADYLTPDIAVKGDIVVIAPPKEIEQYIKTVEEHAQKDPEWFTEYSQNAQSGTPLPYH